MSIATRSLSQRKDTEQAALDRLVQHLTVQFPEVPAEQIVRAVRGEYDGYDASPVRDFVPVLVERAVKSQLGGPTPRHRA